MLNINNLLDKSDDESNDDSVSIYDFLQSNDPDAYGRYYFNVKDVPVVTITKDDCLQ